MNFFKFSLKTTILLVILLSIGCNSSPEKQKNKIFIVSPMTKKSTLTPISSPPSIQSSPTHSTKWWVTPFTPMPTLEFLYQDQFYDILKTNGDCKLPCFLGIIPGKTSLEEAKSILEVYDANHVLTYNEVANSKLAEIFTAEVKTQKDVSLQMIIHIYGKDNKVERVSFFTDVYLDGSYALFDQHLIKYSLREVFLIHGSPDIVYLIPPDPSINFRAYGLYIYYEKEQIMIELSGGGTKNGEGGYTLCPNIGEGDIGSTRFVLGNPDSLIEIRDQETIIRNDVRNNSFLIDEVTDLSIYDFFELMISDQPACFSYPAIDSP